MSDPRMGARLGKLAWFVGALVWATLALQVLSTRAMVEREPVAVDGLKKGRVPGHFVPGDAGPIHVVRRGNKGRHVVLVHGLGGSTFDWEERVMPALAGDFQLTAIDLYGFGYSARNETLRYDLPLWSSQLDAVFKAHGIRRAALVGQSLGAAVVSEYAARTRRRVERLVLLSPLDPVRWSVPLEDAERWRVPILGEVLLSQLDRLTRERAYSASHHVRARQLASVEGTRRALLKCLREPPALDALPAHYGKIRAPTLIVHGEQDALVSVEVARAAAAQIRTAQLTLVPGSGHLLARDQPLVVADSIARFAKTKFAKKKRRKSPPRGGPDAD